MKNIFRFTYFLIFTSFSSSLAVGQGFSWAQSFGNVQNSAGAGAITFDTANNLIIAGGLTGTFDFDQGPGVFNLTSVGNGNMVIFKEDPSGNFMWAKLIAAIGPTLSGMGGKGAITQDANDNIVITGTFRDSFDFDPGPAVYKMSSIGMWGSDPNLFILKLNSSGNFLWAKQVAAPNLISAGGVGIRTDKSGFVYVVSHFAGTIDADPGPGLLNFFSRRNINSQV